MVVGVSGITDRDTEQEVVQSDAEQKLHSTGLQVRRSHKTMKRKSFPLFFLQVFHLQLTGLRSHQMTILFYLKDHQTVRMDHMDRQTIDS